MRSFVINFSLLLLCSLRGEAFRTGNIGRPAQPPLPPVNSDGLKSPSVGAPGAEQVPSPEQNPKELLRHECDILYSKSTEKAAECLELLSEALRVDLPVDPAESLVNNLGDIKLEDLEFLLRLTKSYKGSTPFDIFPLMTSLANLQLAAQSIYDTPRDIDQHNRYLQEAIMRSSLDYYNALNELTLLVTKLLESKLLPENELAKLLIFNSVLRRPSLILPVGAVPRTPLDNSPLPSSEELLRPVPTPGSLGRAALSAAELERFETQLMSTLHQVDALKMSLKFIENLPPTAAPAVPGLDLDSIKSKAPGQDVKPRDVDAKAPAALRVTPVGLN